MDIKKLMDFAEDIESTAKRHGLPEKLSDVNASDIVEQTFFIHTFVKGEDGHIGVYDTDGRYYRDEYDYITAIIDNEDSELALQCLLALDEIVPIENEIYTTISFALKRLFHLGYSTRYSGKQTYLMRDENTGYTKIGKSNNPRKRERTLQSEKPTISLLYTCLWDVESELHARYAAKRVRGEWFNLTDEDILHICRNYNFA